jgi:hypothetical protein
MLLINVEHIYCLVALILFAIALVNVESIEKIVKATLASGRLKDEKPLSCILIAPPEGAKTEIIRKHSLKTENVFYTTDATAYGIIRDTNQLQDFASGELTHIVIPDLLTCLGRKQETVTTFIHFMNALIEEGVVNISTYAINFKGTVKARAGLITAIPPGPFFDKRRHWERIGFLSRALPVSYEYSLGTRIKILQYIQTQQHLKEIIERLKLPKKPKLVKLSYNLAKQIEPFAMHLAASHSKYQSIYGFRYQRHLQTFAKALALLEGKDTVDDQCIKELEKLAEYMNLDFNKV